MIHQTSDIQSVNIGKDTQIWQFCVVLPGAIIGNNCNINFNVFVENDVVIGNNVTIKSGVQIWDGITIEDNVFIGPNVSFTNDLYPRSKQSIIRFLRTVVKRGASIGANATILAGITVGKFALVGAGSLVTKNIGDYELWYGNPAKHMGYVNETGEILDLGLKSKQTGKEYQLKDGVLTPKSNYLVVAENIGMRLITKEDSKFILDLRTDSKLGRNLSHTSSDIEKQFEWIDLYKQREVAGKEFYFVFEDSNAKPWGTIRLYNLSKEHFTVGSWICLPNNMDKIAIKAWILCVEFGFEKLKYDKCLFDVRKQNLSVLYYAYLYHPEIIKEDKLNYFFSLEKKTFYKHREKVVKLLSLKF
jgi:acetyltransferase-like isoleucine patch superfamily enzyme